ncbi:MAG: YidC/Oxa1 family insertase periplasmic-domain containing protein [Thermoguttaceae bacterium]|nr:YidC/Oxa1 family insertase periplasmic-domain containing protein [Thermoguttaceae bacterium]MDW8078353.1 YidC/Oxa1 family insertase periplasmic-domain containing protein [Thermoguttaceae bacterium]
MSMQFQSSNYNMLVRYVLFVTLSMAILAFNAYLYAPRGRKPVSEPPPTVKQPVSPGEAKGPAGQPSALASGQMGQEQPKEATELKTPEDLAAESKSQPSQPPEEVTKPEQLPPLQYVALGSLDPASGYRMLVTLSNRGASVVRIELNDPRYRATDARWGYLGHLGGEGPSGQLGCPVAVVGPGTPAAKSGIRPGDRIVAVDDLPVASWSQVEGYLRKTRPGQRMRITVDREGKPVEVTVQLARQPVEVIRPEWGSPASFLLTLAAVDDQRLVDVRRRVESLREAVEQIKRRLQREKMDEAGLAGIAGELSNLHKEFTQLVHNRKEELRLRFGMASAARQFVDELAADLAEIDPAALELPGVDLRDATWEIVGKTDQSVTFRRRLEWLQLEVEKTYELVRVPEPHINNRSFPGYHLTLRVAIRNLGSEPRRVAYQLDGPNGLPTEGHWYATKVGPGWGAYGLRDVAVAWHGGRWDLISCWRIAEGRPPLWREEHGQILRYLGVDAQYFSVVLLPQRSDLREERYHAAQPIRFGPVRTDRKNLTNTSCQLMTIDFSLPGNGGELVHEYRIFAGPKRPALLAHYGLRELVVYGWFWWVAIPLLWLLHFLHDYVLFNYGLAIIALTVLVRLAMFPLSRKQALAAQKMQQIQPELRRIYEKYKNDPQQRLRAQQELFRKYNYNPLGGCLILLLQLPVFIGLYRALMVDVELRAAPLISDAIRWCSDLSAPDMLLDWSGFWAALGWHWFNEGYGLFALGPYFNILPVLTIALFIWQQKVLSPPPADEQAAMQQRVMTFMLIFMGVLFYKVASGLCLYFIASSLWGLAERQFLPKLAPPKEEEPPPPPPKPSARKGEGWLERLRSRLEELTEESGRKKPRGSFGSRQLRRMLSKKTKKNPPS